MHAPIDAIVLGLSPTGLYAVRELSRARRRVLGVDDAPACAAHSSAMRAHWRCTDEEQLLQRLVQLGMEQAEPPVLVPTSDKYIEFVCRHAAALQTNFHFPHCYIDGADVLLDKLKFHHLCQRHGVATPGVWEVADRQALAAMAGQIVFPCILKPALIHRARPFLHGEKVLLARTPDELGRLLDSLPNDVGGWLVQEVIPGAESRITLFGAYVDRGGEVRQAFTARKLRQYPPGFGSASLVMSETDTLSRDFLRAIGFRGICGTEFKRDPRDGRLKIIEINPRPTLWFQLCHAAGKRIVEAAFCDLRGLPAPVEHAQRNGVRWRYLLKDLASSLFYRRHGNGFVFPRPDLTAAGARRGRAWAVFDARDPLPALAEPLVYLRKWWGGR